MIPLMLLAALAAGSGSDSSLLRVANPADCDVAIKARLNRGRNGGYVGVRSDQSTAVRLRVVLMTATTRDAYYAWRNRIHLACLLGTSADLPGAEVYVWQGWMPSRARAMSAEDVTELVAPALRDLVARDGVPSILVAHGTGAAVLLRALASRAFPAGWQSQYASLLLVSAPLSGTSSTAAARAVLQEMRAMDHTLTTRELQWTIDQSASSEQADSLFHSRYGSTTLSSKAPRVKCTYETVATPIENQRGRRVISTFIVTARDVSSLCVSPDTRVGLPHSFWEIERASSRSDPLYREVIRFARSNEFYSTNSPEPPTQNRHPNPLAADEFSR